MCCVRPLPSLPSLPRFCPPPFLPPQTRNWVWQRASAASFSVVFPSAQSREPNQNSYTAAASAGMLFRALAHRFTRVIHDATLLIFEADRTVESEVACCWEFFSCPFFPICQGLSAQHQPAPVPSRDGGGPHVHGGVHEPLQAVRARLLGLAGDKEVPTDSDRAAAGSAEPGAGGEGGTHRSHRDPRRRSSDTPRSPTPQPPQKRERKKKEINRKHESGVMLQSPSPSLCGSSLLLSFRFFFHSPILHSFILSFLFPFFLSFFFFRLAHFVAAGKVAAVSAPAGQACPCSSHCRHRLRPGGGGQRRLCRLRQPSDNR